MTQAPQPDSPPGPDRRHATALALILLAAAGLRGAQLGRLSLWYDEVVPMRLARTAGPRELVRLLDQIEATRAPLHPLLLQAWLRLFGPGDVAGRMLSVACGVATVGLVYRLGRVLYDSRTGLWAAWLAAVSPLLVAYSREAKMYAWLVALTCGAWLVLISFRRSAPFWNRAAYALILAALAYSQPLGAFMIAALGVAYLANWRAYALRPGAWLLVQVAAGLMILPWAGRYLDHEPEVTTPPTLRLLLGLPIGYVGGNFVTLAACLGLVLIGLISVRREEGSRRTIRVDQPFAATTLLAWFALPPLALFGYSLVGHPLFGQARYTLFVGPAYLLLLARGLVKLPGPVRLAAALVGLALSAALLRTIVFAPDLKADWRAASADLDGGVPVVVVSADPSRNVEVEVARYYLSRPGAVLAAEDAPLPSADRIALAIPTRGGAPVIAPPGRWLQHWPRRLQQQDYPGLRIERRAKE